MHVGSAYREQVWGEKRKEKAVALLAHKQDWLFTVLLTPITD